MTGVFFCVIIHIIENNRYNMDKQKESQWSTIATIDAAGLIAEKMNGAIPHMMMHSGR